MPSVCVGFCEVSQFLIIFHLGSVLFTVGRATVARGMRSASWSELKEAFHAWSWWVRPSRAPAAGGRALPCSPDLRRGGVWKEAFVMLCF